MKRAGWIFIGILIATVLLQSTAAWCQQADFIKNLKTNYRSAKPYGTKARPFSNWSDWQQAISPTEPDFVKLQNQREQLEGLAVLKAYEDWIIGHPPAKFKPKVNPVAEVIDSAILNEVKYRLLAITVNLPDRAPIKIMVKTYLPIKPIKQSSNLIAGKPRREKYPVLLTQYNHSAWALMAARRGYWGVAYSAADMLDTGDSLAARYPEADWSTLHRRAIVGQLVLDWLVKQEQADTSKISLAGHSRNGKQSLILAVIDKRIKAVISSSAGTGGDTDWQFTGPLYNSETIEKITGTFPDWFSPKVRWFIGKESYLPVEQHQLMQLIVPRRLLIISSYIESQINPWAVNETLKLASSGLPNQAKPQLYLRNGRHAVDEDDIETMIDWVDGCFGYGDPISWPDPFPESMRGARTVMSHIAKPLGWAARISEPHFQQLVIGFPQTNLAERVDFGSYDGPGPMLNISVYGPKDFMRSKKKYPALIWCHEGTHQAAWQRLPGYWIDSIIAKGYLLVCSELPGFGTRWPNNAKHRTRHGELPGLEQAIHELDVIVKSVQMTDYVDTTNVALAGHLFGSTITQCYIEARPQKKPLKAYLHNLPDVGPQMELIRQYGRDRRLRWYDHQSIDTLNKPAKIFIEWFSAGTSKKSSKPNETHHQLTGYGRIEDWPLWRWLR